MIKIKEFRKFLEENNITIIYNQEKEREEALKGTKMIAYLNLDELVRYPGFDIWGRFKKEIIESALGL